MTRVREELVQWGLIARIVVLGVLVVVLDRVWPEKERV